MTAIDLRAGELRFYRPKVDVEQTHRLTSDTLRAALAYLHHDASALGPLLRLSRKDGRLHDMGMSARAITARVRVLGLAIGVHGLSAHDCRHHWATQAAKHKTPIPLLRCCGVCKPTSPPG